MASLAPPLPPTAGNTRFAQAIFQLTKGYVFLVVKDGLKRALSWESDLDSYPAVLMTHYITLGKFTFFPWVLVSFSLGPLGWSDVL